jgi:dihydropteroate synthase
VEFTLGRHTLDLTQPRIMGVLNRTPDSFSDGGRYTAFDAALSRAESMVKEGADILDVGGESTRPGAEAVSVQEELDRVLPLIERLTRELDVPVSADTGKAEVMQAAVEAGAAMINDVYALRQPGALEAAAKSGAALCLMHMQGEPRSMQKHPHYQDVVAEVAGFLMQRAEVAIAAGVPRERILLDPGFGFGKNLEHNLELLRHLPELAALGFPLLVGLSRKSMIGTLLGGKPVEERVHGSVAAALLAVQRGARIVRVHDVAATADALKLFAATAVP